MAAFARFSSSGASNDQAFQHDATPQSPKYITNATLRPSGEVTDRLGAPVRHRRGVRAAQQVSRMGSRASQNTGPTWFLTLSWCIRSSLGRHFRCERLDRREQQEGQILLWGPCVCCCETEGSRGTDSDASSKL